MASDYAWIITRDYLADDRHDDTGRCGPSDASETMIEQARKHGKAFRMYDDDGELYFSGRIVACDGHESTSGPIGNVTYCNGACLADPVDVYGFTPLDDYGMPGAGCTEIRYRDASGKWVAL